ncbi:VanW like protein [Kineothrix alysoides]|uniref:VanW like protein n=1 Tax=Kineothrix alysoides TaxID=1469948 RepID=A0A4R1QNV7_9FIRM|nr:VanW family protein [Kineothrix alysoides]TCL54653.1 VanW like protein [Kineothrix alysoides]
MNKWTKFVALTLCLCLLPGMAVQAREIPTGGIDYTSVFDADYYYNNYPDVQKAVEHDADKLLMHFITSGMKEGRIGKAEFDVRAYMRNNLDLIPVLGIKDLSAYYYHYIQSGKAEGRVATQTGTQTDVNEISSYSTKYNIDEDRAVNVELASARIDGMVIQPKETFSFSKSILSRTLENGYKVAPSFASGRVVTSIGGGICQVSSTLYVAMLLSSIPATERYTHSLEVDYVPQGLDSAIVEGAKDLKFKNPYDYPVCIHSIVEDGNLTVSISKVTE